MYASFIGLMESQEDIFSRADFLSFVIDICLGANYGKTPRTSRDPLQPTKEVIDAHWPDLSAMFSEKELQGLQKQNL